MAWSLQLPHWESTLVLQTTWAQKGLKSSKWEKNSMSKKSSESLRSELIAKAFRILVENTVYLKSFEDSGELLQE